MTDVFPADFVTLQNAVINKLRLEATDDRTKVKNWINRAYYKACIETNFYESSSAAAALAVNATSVAVPAAVVKIEYVVPTLGAVTYSPMEEITFEEILERRAYSGGATSDSGAPSRYAYRSASAPSIEFWPQASGGEVLTFYGLLLPTALSGDTDAPIFPEPYREVIEYGALVQAAEFKKDLLMLDTYQADYQDAIRRFRAFNNTRAGSKVQQLRVEGQRPAAHRNDVDLGW